MLFHSLSGPEVHGVIDEMDRRAKSEAPAISSAIDRGDTETVGARLRGPGQKLGRGRIGLRLCSPKFGGTLGSVLRAARDWTLGICGQDARPVAPGSRETRVLGRRRETRLRPKFHTLKVEKGISPEVGAKSHPRWLSFHFKGLFGRQPRALHQPSALAAFGAGKDEPTPQHRGLQATRATFRLLAIGVPISARFQGSKSSRPVLFVVRISGLLAGPTRTS